MNEFLSTAKPLYYVSRLVGLFPFQYKKLGKSKDRLMNTLQISLFQVLYSVFLIITIICCFVLMIRNRMSTLYVNFSFSFTVFDFLTSLLKFAGCVVSLIQLSVILPEKLGDAILTISDIDKLLSKYISINITKKALRIIMTEILITVTYLFVLCTYDFLSLNNNIGRLDCILRYVMSSIIFVTCLQFINFSLLVANRCKILNNEIEKLCNKINLQNTYVNIHIAKINENSHILNISGTNKIYILDTEERIEKLDNLVQDWRKKISSDEFIERLRNFRKIHILLNDLVLIINRCYGMQILFIILGSATKITLNIHIALLLLEEDDFSALMHESAKTMLIVSLAWTFPALVKIFGITGSCEAYKRETARTALLIQKLWITPNMDIEISVELQLFSQQILHTDFKFSASGFFILDFSFLCSTFGSIASFLVVLTQFWETYEQEHFLKSLV
ncbi:hypothetical protein L9F63_010233 [Diploptera punctata]|uniref:Gustatory receptor n=1 Tax=Diploptera punctata TaxID=6984 RepID=A0AAD8EQT9_DIPPU|nr:hypothetical protein L9F63_010233 [Diploptera punctata]